MYLTSAVATLDTDVTLDAADLSTETKISDIVAKNENIYSNKGKFEFAVRIAQLIFSLEEDLKTIKCIVYTCIQLYLQFNQKKLTSKIKIPLLVNRAKNMK